MARRSRAERTAETCPVTHALLADAINPIIEWIEGERGRKTDFVIKFRSSIHPDDVSRNQVESWINPSPEKRVEPSFGYGLALMATAQKLGIYRATKPQTTKETE